MLLCFGLPFILTTVHFAFNRSIHQISGEYFVSENYLLVPKGKSLTYLTILYLCLTRVLYNVIIQQNFVMIDKIDIGLIGGCDLESEVYCRTYNQLQPFIDQIDDCSIDSFDNIDLSAFGLYLCKFIEQELNSSVIQLCRKSIGVLFPDYFCAVDPLIPKSAAAVNTAPYNKNPHWVNLNESLDYEHPEVLRMIPMGEAYYVLRTLSKNDTRFFADYAFLRNERFIELWRDIFRLRNCIAHPGSIISKEVLYECYQKCKEFIDVFLPSLIKIKDTLAPNNWKGFHAYVPAAIGNKEINIPSVEKIMAGFKSTNLPKATVKEYLAHEELISLISKEYDGEIASEIQRLETSYDWFDTIFTENGKLGVKDILGKIVVPAEYDDIMELQSKILTPYNSTIVKKSGKMGFVQRYTGKVFGEIVYDNLRVIEGYRFAYFQKNGTKSYGIVCREDGREVVPCLIDDIKTTKTGFQNFIFRSGEKFGLYSAMHDVYLEPVFDDICEPEQEGEPYLFTLDGVDGYMSKFGKFYTCKEYTLMQEENYTGEFIDPLDFIIDYIEQ